MSEDRRVKGRSDEEVRRHAKNTKVDYRVDRLRPVNILRLLRSGSVPTLYGRKKLVLKVVDDEALGKIDAKTETSKDTVTITCKRSVERDAELGVGRPRMTLAHELGHAVMHSGEPDFRHAGAQGKTALSDETPYISAEHQAKVFASAFLIHDEDAAGMAVEEISVEFGVSLEAARICFDRLQRKAERARSAERVLKMAEEVKAALRKNQESRRQTYLEDVCTVCHQQTLVANGLKVSCETCGYNGDRFQDGDKAA
jgi:hypothetical protein